MPECFCNELRFPLGGTVPFGYQVGDDGELVPVEAAQEAILEMAPLQAQGLSLRAIAAAM